MSDVALTRSLRIVKVDADCGSFLIPLVCGVNPDGSAGSRLRLLLSFMGVLAAPATRS